MRTDPIPADFVGLPRLLMSALAQWLAVPRRASTTLSLVLAFCNGVPVAARCRRDSQWQRQVLRYAETEGECSMAVHCDGRDEAAWSFPIAGETCHSLMRHDVPFRLIREESTTALGDWRSAAQPPRRTQDDRAPHG